MERKLCTYISTKCVESKLPDFQDIPTRTKQSEPNIYMENNTWIVLVVNIQDVTHIVQPKFNRFPRTLSKHPLHFQVVPKNVPTGRDSKSLASLRGFTVIYSLRLLENIFF